MIFRELRMLRFQVHAIDGPLHDRFTYIHFVKNDMCTDRCMYVCMYVCITSNEAKAFLTANGINWWKELLLNHLTVIR